MERSISLDSSSIGLNAHYHSDSITVKSNNNHNNKKANTSNTFNTHKAAHLRHAFEQRQNHVEQQAGSGDDELNKATTTTVNVASTHRPQHKSIGTLTHYLSKRKRPLQRQRPMEHHDDMDYAADLEEEEDEDEDEDEDIDHAREHDSNYYSDNKDHNKNNKSREVVMPTASYPSKLAIAPAHQKRLQFQKYRQHSNVAMPPTPTNPNSPPAPPSTSAMPSSSTGNTTTASPCPLPAHSLAHHATRSSSTSSATSLDSHFKHQDSFESSVSLDAAPHNRRQQFFSLKRDNSMQSDSSRYSSLECMLEARKPDPEAILINLGFGPVDSDDILSRIPARFLKPSQVRGIDTDAFVKRLQLQLQLADHSVLGYRGLTGNSDMPPSLIVAKIMQRFEVNERKKSMGSLEHTI